MTSIHEQLTNQDMQSQYAPELMASLPDLLHLRDMIKRVAFDDPCGEGTVHIMPDQQGVSRSDNRSSATAGYWDISVTNDGEIVSDVAVRSLPLQANGTEVSVLTATLRRQHVELFADREQTEATVKRLAYFSDMFGIELAADRHVPSRRIRSGIGKLFARVAS